MVVVLIPATLFGLKVGAAVIFHEGSTPLVVANALRLLAIATGPRDGAQLTRSIGRWSDTALGNRFSKMLVDFEMVETDAGRGPRWWFRSEAPWPGLAPTRHL
jgi:hypothetical protein